MINKGSIVRSAKISDDKQYRYFLRRVWDERLGGVVFIMLNPSYADDEIDDNTIKKCMHFADDWGKGYIEVVNLFAFRSTDPERLKKCIDPVGELNKFFVNKAIQRADFIVVAWGNRGNLLDKSKEIKELLNGKQVYCFDVTKENQPMHPRNASYECKLKKYVV